MFVDVPISMASRAKSEVESIQCVLEVVSLSNEKRHIPALLCLSEFAEKQQHEFRC